MLNQFNRIFKLIHRRHSSRSQNNNLRRIISQNIKQLQRSGRVNILTKRSRLINKHNNILLIKFAKMHILLPLISLMLDNIFFIFGVMVSIEHVVTAIQIRDDEIDYFFIFAAETVDNSGIVIVLIFDRFLHSSQRKFLIIIIRITSNLNSHRSNQTRIQNLIINILLIDQLSLINQIRQR